MKTLLVLSVCLFGIEMFAADGTGPKVGDKPPLLQATTLLQAPPGAKVDAKALRGKVIVLEFWATWCGPCVGAIPHLNELADKFKDQPVQFIAITDEEQSVVDPFLKKRPIKAWVALDTDKAMNRAYDVGAIPHTVLIDRDGRIAGITHPMGLTEQHLKDLVARKKIAFAEPARGIYAGEDPNEKSQTQPLFQVLIRPSTATNASSVGGDGKFTATGYAVWDILPRAFASTAASHARIITNAALPDGHFDFIISQKSRSDDAVTDLLQHALKSAFGLVGRTETRSTDVLLLKVKNPDAPGLLASPTPSGMWRTGPGIIEANNFSMDGLAQAIESTLNKPVINETGLTNHYDVLLKWDQTLSSGPKPEALAKVLETKMGLELVPDTRPIEMTLIEKEKP